MARIGGEAMICKQHNVFYKEFERCEECVKQQLGEEIKPKIVELAPRDNRTVKSTLDKAAETNFVECLVIGMDDEGKFVFLSSGMSNRDGLWLAEKAKRWIMEGE